MPESERLAGSPENPAELQPMKERGLWLRVRVREAVICHTRLPDEVRHLAELVEQTLDELQGHPGSDRLPQAAASLRAQTERLAACMLQLRTLAGELDGLAMVMGDGRRLADAT